MRAKEMPHVPFRSARDHDFSLDGRLAGFAARREKLVVVEVAVEVRGGEGGFFVVMGGLAFLFGD